MFSTHWKYVSNIPEDPEATAAVNTQQFAEQIQSIIKLNYQIILHNKPHAWKNKRVLPKEL